MLHAINQKQESMFHTAMPYGAVTLGVGIVGAITAVAATSTVGLIVGIALAILGGYGSIGVISCGMTSRNSYEFNQNVWKHIATTAFAGAIEVVTMVGKAVVLELILGRNNRN